MGSDDFLEMEGQKIALVLDGKDNVGIVLADVKKGESCVIRGKGEEHEISAVEDIAFGHKIALENLVVKTPVLKYGEEIGIMREPIAKGGWIHSHNMHCERGL